MLVPRDSPRLDSTGEQQRLFQAAMQQQQQWAFQQQQQQQQQQGMGGGLGLGAMGGMRR